MWRGTSPPTLNGPSNSNGSTSSSAPNVNRSTWSQISAVRTVRAGTQVILHIQQTDTDSQLVVEQWWTTVFLGLHALAGLGSPPADHAYQIRYGLITSARRPTTSTSRSLTGTPRCPGTGQHITSTSKPHERAVSASCSPTVCARWRYALTVSSASSVSRIPAESRGWRCGSRRRRPWVQSSEWTRSASTTDLRIRGDL